MSKFTDEEKAKEAGREVKMRQGVYARARKSRGLSSEQQRRIAIMQEIADEYRKSAETEKLF